MGRQAIDSLELSEQQSCNHLGLRDIEPFDVIYVDGDVEGPFFVGFDDCSAEHSLVSQLPSVSKPNSSKDNNDLPVAMPYGSVDRVGGISCTQEE